MLQHHIAHLFYLIRLGARSVRLQIQSWRVPPVGANRPDIRTKLQSWRNDTFSSPGAQAATTTAPEPARLEVGTARCAVPARVPAGGPDGVNRPLARGSAPSPDAQGHRQSRGGDGSSPHSATAPEPAWLEVGTARCAVPARVPAGGPDGVNRPSAVVRFRRLTLKATDKVGVGTARPHIRPPPRPPGPSWAISFHLFREPRQMVFGPVLHAPVFRCI